MESNEFASVPELSTGEQTDSSVKMNLTKMGWHLATLVVVAQCSGIVILLLLQLLFPQLVEQNFTFFSVLLSLVAMDLIAVPIFWALSRKLPNAKMHDNKFTIIEFFGCLSVLFFFEFVGALLGRLAQSVIAVDQSEQITDIVSGSAGIVSLIYVGIVGPFFEEMVFRKWLIDKTAFKGRRFAILLSGLCFGLFHCNLSQFFYATLIGFLFAYIYERTGKIWITIAYHMIMNLTSLGLAQLVSPNAITVSPIEMIIGLLMIVLYICGGVYFFVNLKRVKVEENEGAPSIAGSIGELFKNGGIWGFYMVCILFLVVSLVATAAETNADIQNAVDITVTIEKKDSEYSLSPKTCSDRFEVENSGDYIFSFEWSCDEKPSFITGACVRDSEDNIVTYVTGDIVSATMDSIHLEPGTYSVEYTMLATKEECLSYCEDCGSPVENPENFEVPDYLGDEGSFEMHYEMSAEPQ